jgi:hypothetical protein
MSALGQKQTFSELWAMSALPPKADIDAPVKEHEGSSSARLPWVGDNISQPNIQGKRQWRQTITLH